MQAFTVIDKMKVPEGRQRHGTKWGAIFDDLPMSKAVRFDCESAHSARRLGCTLLTSFRYHQASYGVHIRTCRGVENGSRVLYAWKEPKAND